MVAAAIVARCAPSAGAQALDGLTLHWDAPAQCPDAAALRERIERHLPAGRRDARPFVVQGRIEVEDRARYRMQLELRAEGTHARRSVEGESCAALADVAALLIALALDPENAADGEAVVQPRADERLGDAPPDTKEAGRPQPQDAARPGAAQAPPASAESAANALDMTAQDAVTKDADDRDDADDAIDEAPDGGGWAPAIGLELGAALRFDAGMLPQTPAVGLSPQLGLRIDRTRVRAALTFWLQARANADRYPSAALDAHGLAGHAALCFELVSSPVVFEPCAAAEIGELVLTTRGISMPATSTARWGAAGFGIRAAYRLAGGLHAGLDALALAPFNRPRWLLRTPEGDVEVFVAAQVALRISAAITYVFD